MYDWHPADDPLFGLRDVPQLGPVDVPWTSPFTTFEYLFFPVKGSHWCVRLFHLKNTFFIKSSVFLLVPYEFLKSSPKVPDVRWSRGPLGNVPGTSSACLMNSVNSKKITSLLTCNWLKITEHFTQSIFLLLCVKCLKSLLKHLLKTVFIQ